MRHTQTRATIIIAHVPLWYTPGGGVFMDYRLFFLDGARHIEKAHEYQAEDDREAIGIAEAWREGRRMELWNRDRRVKRWD